MSESSDKGKEFEKDVVAFTNKMLKPFGIKITRDSRSGAGSHKKTDADDWFAGLPLSLEIKNDKSFSVKAWFKQARGGAYIARPPAAVFKMEEEMLVVLRYKDLLNFIVEAMEGNVEIKRLREPIIKTAEGTPVDVSTLKPSAAKGSWSECRGGNVVSPGSKKCLVKTCQYCSNKKVKKAK